AVVEANHDDNGIIWPVSVAPFEVVITVVRVDDEQTRATAEDLHNQLEDADVDVLLDDRVERPGVKFADSELIGIPYRITVGPRGVAEGVVELTERRGLEKKNVELGEVAVTVIDAVGRHRFGV
ncbi:MAG: His/Gly/Thr/Pro-type tRNA ligase C-terminal domain-containing protein, partial [Acidimicrobiia bacterium]